MYNYIVDNAFIGESDENIIAAHGFEGTAIFDKTFTSDEGSVRIFTAAQLGSNGKRFLTIVATSKNSLEMIRFMMAKKRAEHTNIVTAIEGARNG